MIKIEIYPFNHPDRILNGTFIAQDLIDFNAQPIISDLLGWVMGSESKQTGSGTIDLLSETYAYIPNMKIIPCLMAVTEVDGKITMFEHYRVKILKEK